jgi:hypothetical protein
VHFIFWNFGIQMIQGAGTITILYGQAYQVRHVRMNVPHPATVTPSWYGDSVGHYEGDTLVIDTVGVKADRPLAKVDFYGTPYTQALHVVERYRLLDYASTIDALKQAEKENFRGAQFRNDVAYRWQEVDESLTNDALRVSLPLKHGDARTARRTSKSRSSRMARCR